MVTCMIWIPLLSCINIVFHILQEVGAELQLLAEDMLTLDTLTQALTNFNNHPHTDGVENQESKVVLDVLLEWQVIHLLQLIFNHN